MGFTKSLSDQLQSEDIDFAMSADIVASTAVDTLRSLRNEDTWDMNTSPMWLPFTTLTSRNQDNVGRQGGPRE